jgi:hypothetical protein
MKEERHPSDYYQADYAGKKKSVVIHYLDDDWYEEYEKRTACNKKQHGLQVQIFKPAFQKFVCDEQGYQEHKEKRRLCHRSALEIEDYVAAEEPAQKELYAYRIPFGVFY